MVTHDWLVKLAKGYEGSAILSLKVLLIISIIEGIINCIMVMPLDCIKTNMQQFNVQGYNSMGGSIKLIYKRYGLLGFYAGFSPTLLKYCIHAVLTTPALERMRDIFNLAMGG